jgi:hypothetical protein
LPQLKSTTSVKNKIEKISLRPSSSAQKAIMEEIYIPKVFRKLITIDETPEESIENPKPDKNPKEN